MGTKGVGNRMDESILNSIKKLLGIVKEDTDFDTDIIIHINSILSVISQFGVGPAGGYSITGESERWSDFLKEDKLLNSVKTYVYLRVRLLFDPPSSSAVLESFNRTISEFEWRINLSAEDKKEGDT